MKEETKSWIFVHLGARAHYQFPEAVSDKIHTMYTDIWIPQNFITRFLSLIPSSSLRKTLQRSHLNIDNSKIISFPFSLFYNEFLWKVRGIKGWGKVIKRNEWFQHKVKNHLNNNFSNGSFILFTFAYTAFEPLKFAKEKGWKTILYQMDPGQEEEEIVKKEFSLASITSSWQPAPEVYWKAWKEELKLTDKIIVNSHWSKSALIKVNAPVEKIEIMPLALEANKEGINFNRSYPTTFSSARPLKILFLGILTIRKGLRPILEAIELLKNEPVEFIFVGTPETKIRENHKVKVVPSVSRSETGEFYKNADIFLFPTLSDGFGLTQLEAFQWKLPVISSRRCGEVVEDNINGIVVQEVTAKAISNAILKCLANPALLQDFAQNTQERMNSFTITRLRKELKSLSEK